MKLAKLALVLGVLASCVDDAPPTDVTVQEAAQGDCMGNFGTTAPLPAYTAWSGALPSQISTQEIFVTMPLDGNNWWWALYQVDLVKRKVSRAIYFNQQQKPAVFAAIGGGTRPAGGVRVPPPVGPGPIGDDWRQANYIVNTAARFYYAPDNGYYATP